MIAENSVKLGFYKAILVQPLAILRAGIIADIYQWGLLCQECILQLRQKGYLLLIPKS